MTTTLILHRPKSIAFVAMMAFALVTLAFLTGCTAEVDAEMRTYAGINAIRTKAGLPPLTPDEGLVRVARARSDDMATRNYFSHTTPEGEKFLGMLSQRGIGYKYAGEILARNNYPDAQAPGTAMTTYLNSAPHKAILMDGRYNLVGVGYARSDEDSMHYFTVIFVQR